MEVGLFRDDSNRDPFHQMRSDGERAILKTMAAWHHVPHLLARQQREWAKRAINIDPTLRDETARGVDPV